MNRALREEAGNDYHQRQAARFRRLAANATTPGIKDRLLTQADEHERLAGGLDQQTAAETADDLDPSSAPAADC